jgi:hypothetical protein
MATNTKRLVAGVAFTAFMTTTAVAQETWGVKEVDAYVTANKPVKDAAADPFAAPKVAPAPATAVVLEYPVYGPADTSTNRLENARWTYDVETQKLTVKYSSSGAGSLIDWQGKDPGGSVLSAPRLRQGFVTFSKSTSEDAGPGSNAYGATVQLKRLTVEKRGVAELIGGFDDPIKYPSGDYQFEWTTTITPEEGRALVAAMRLQVRSTPKEWTTGRYVLCAGDYLGATIQRPTIFTTNGCYLTARHENIRLVDSRDGTVLKEWKRTAR